MRIQSPKALTLKGGEIGWIHEVNGPLPKIVDKPRPEPVINVGKIMKEWQAKTFLNMVDELAEQLSVKRFALTQLGCAWSGEHRAWGFPMADGYGNLVGIRLRTPDGHKFAVRGSHQGVFLPTSPPEDGMALVCEGPTDTAAALSLGFYAIGRPSCSAGMSDILTAFRRLRVTSAVIISDNDEVGSRGGLALQRHLRIRSALIVLPAKDLRSFVQLGGTRELLDSMISSLVWQQT